MDDVKSLIRDSDRFSIDRLMVFTPHEWLNKRNQVAFKFIEALVQNNRDTDTLSQEMFDCTIEDNY